jgi:hypothetical protein
MDPLLVVTVFLFALVALLLFELVALLPFALFAVALLVTLARLVAPALSEQQSHDHDWEANHHPHLMYWLMRPSSSSRAVK